MLNRSALDAGEVTDQLSKFDPTNVEAMYHKQIFGQIALDYEEIINAVSMIPESDDNYEAARAELRLARHVQETGTLLAFVYDRLNDRPQALRFYKIFYKLYKDCDPFYQDNVKHAKRRIEDIERMQLKAK